MKKIVIIGFGGFAKEVKWLIEDINRFSKEWDIVAFLDDNPINKGKSIDGIPVIGKIEDIILDKNKEVYYTCAIADPITRKNIVYRANNIGLKPSKLIHPSVEKSNSVSIGEGCIICANVILTVDIIIGDYVILNIASTVGHDVYIGDYVTILPSTNISGNVTLDKFVTMGTGSCVIQGLKIEENSFIGAGAVVVNNILKNSIAVGIPAKIIKNR